MFPCRALLVLLALYLLAVAASPVHRTPGGISKVTLNFIARLNATGISNIADADRVRIKSMREKTVSPRKRDASVSVTNSVVLYVAQVGIGSPPTEYTLLVDTGSSNTWIGANQPYTPTSTSHYTGNTVSVSYGSGNFSGGEYIDTVSLGNGLTINQQSIGVATRSQGLSGTGIDGILGLGPADLTQGTVSNTNTVPTVVDNLYSQGTISSAVLGVYFIPAANSNSGELTFGGYDPSVVTGTVNYVPITNTYSSAFFWGIDQSITYGGKTILPSTAGIVDTGTTLILIATDAFQTYQSATGGVMDNATGLLRITQSQYNNLQTLSFHIGTQTYDLIPNVQIWPRSLNTAIGGSSGSIYLVVGDIGAPSGSGMDFANGYAFLERYYSIYDTTGARVGFAATRYTDSESN
ncbi:aspartic peptidase domain-containing protein [Pisolithus orientalis]|uniref:aspartic peptidase domain-containing protein n=1 Tax=Pisolithus orientalis TaxID=936130 RepID=UPI00222422FF|nr:aspartic peptidase domain-containing protein [Pisolithus orientalis]KAI6007641.1 aspartic peptidase domain-containing protein [Pisolithus orientalis]